MPFEAGLAYGRHRQDPEAHDLLLIDTHPHRHHHSISDASGLDIQAYQGRATSVIGCVRRFLDSRADDVPGQDCITRRYDRFRRNLRRAAGPHGVTVAEINQWAYARKLHVMMVEWIRDNK